MDRLYSNSLSPGSSFLLIPSQLSQMNDRLSNEKRVNRRAPSFTLKLSLFTCCCHFSRMAIEEMVEVETPWPLLDLFAYCHNFLCSVPIPKSCQNLITWRLSWVDLWTTVLAAKPFSLIWWHTCRGLSAVRVNMYNQPLSDKIVNNGKYL